MPLKFLPLEKRHLWKPAIVVFDTSTKLGKSRHVVFDTSDPVFRPFSQATGVVFPTHLHNHLPPPKTLAAGVLQMGMRRVKSWEPLKDRSQYEYANLPDDDLLAMKAIARAYCAMFMVDSRSTFVEVMNLSGLAAINDELWKRGLTPAQQGMTK